MTLFPDAMRAVALSAADSQGGINTPPEQDFNTPAMQGSMQQVLSENLGEFVVVEFLIGTQTMERKEGILYAVGSSFLTLFDERTQTFAVCDMFSVKFVTFYLPGQRPWRMENGYADGAAAGGAAVGPGPGGGVSLSGIPGCGGGVCGYRSLNGR